MTTNRYLDLRTTLPLAFALLVCACATTLQVTDTSGHKVSLDTPHLAEQHLDGSKVVVYSNTPDDIDQLIRELQKLGVTDRQLLNPETWSAQTCSLKNSPPCSAHCSNGGICSLRSYGSSRNLSYGSWVFRWCDCSVDK
jgi:hypothetical protein